MPINTYLIGLTGGIGSGKSTAGELFKTLGITVIDTDQIARDVVAPGSTALQQIADHFGLQIILDDGSLDRAALRKIVFEDSDKRVWLEKLTHPLINSQMDELISSSQSPYTLLMSPLLFETEQYKRVKKTILIDLPEAMQLERASSRDSNSAEQIKKIMAAQMSRAERQKLADYIIINDKTTEVLEGAVLTLHKQLLHLTQSEDD